MNISQDKVPATLDEAIELLKATISEKDKAAMLETEPGMLHFGFGMALRNAWGLWEDGTPLKLFFRDTYGLGHADDLSAIILEGVWADVKGEPRPTDALVARFKEHWAKAGVSPINGKPI